MQERGLISVTKLTSATVFVDAHPSILNEIDNWFKALSPTRNFDPRFQQKYWDGYVHVFQPHTQHLPIGLLGELRTFADRGGYYIEKDWDDKPIAVELSKFNKFLNLLDVRLPENSNPRKYQLAAVWDSITKRRVNIEVPTSGGKTLISYLMVRWWHAMGLKTLLVVPTTTLVEQTYGDWFDFGWDGVRDNVHRVYSEYEKWFGAPVTISTWQSIFRDYNIFEDFDALIIDEGHHAKAKSLMDISNWCCNAEYRVGMSGSYPDRDNRDEKLSYFNVVGSLGPMKKYTDYKEMEEQGWIPRMEITAIILKYSLPVRRQIAGEVQQLREDKKALEELRMVDPEAAKGKKLPDPHNFELDRIHNLEQRNDFICKLIEKSCKGNTMVLFTKVKKHGIPLKKALEKYFANKGKRVLYIDGDVKTAERNMARAIAEKNDDLIILASYGTFSTGISIKNLHNIVFASGYKAKTKVLQSIGRGLRNLPGKVKVLIFDIVDDMSIQTSDMSRRYTNSSLRHYTERAKIYVSKGFNWRSIKYKF